MANIVYGVSGEGSGHSSRALAMGAHLVARGHTNKMVSYDLRAAAPGVQHRLAPLPKNSARPVAGRL